MNRTIKGKNGTPYEYSDYETLNQLIEQGLVTHAAALEEPGYRLWLLSRDQEERSEAPDSGEEGEFSTAGSMGPVGLGGPSGESSATGGLGLLGSGGRGPVGEATRRRFGEPSRIMEPDPESAGFMKGLVFVLSAQDVDGLVSEWEYQGFDPLTTHKEMVRKGMAGSRSAVDFSRDVSEILVFYSLRGTKISKALKRMKDTGKEKLRILKDRYAIVDHRPSDKTVITVGRVAATYPSVTMWIYSSRNVQGLVTDPSLRDFPNCLRTPVAVSTIPKSEKHAIKAAFKYNIAFTRIVNKGKCDMDTQRQFFLAALNSEIFTEEERQTLWKSFGLHHVDFRQFVGDADEDPTQ